jgi:phosphoribosylanthranilate isomerase
LLDTAVPGLHGGTGRTFDWPLAAGLGREVVNAGGLDPGNVAEAVRAARPWGVDVSSGIVSAPGVKDHEEMRRFVEALR